RFIKKRIHSMLGFKYFDTATSILSGVEVMHMIKKEQVDLRDQSVQNQKEFIHQLFGLAA
ncbi:IS6 family transposase, partial [Bacillus mycoides]